MNAGSNINPAGFRDGSLGLSFDGLRSRPKADTPGPRITKAHCIPEGCQTATPGRLRPLPG